MDFEASLLWFAFLLTYDLCDLDQLTGFQKPQLPHL